MSIIKDNVLVTGASGKLGKQIVFRLWSGDTFLTKAPVWNRSAEESEPRKAHKLRFKAASIYAKKVMGDVDLKPAYQKKCKARQNVFARAMQDFLNAPNIDEINLSNYTGEPDSFIRIYATDDFRVNKVRVRIENQQGETVETGLAERESDTDWWKFIATVANPLSEGGKVIVSAYDLPGNEATKEMSF